MSYSDSNDRFWMVYVAGERDPRVKHFSMFDAIEEAKRLAKKTGKKVYVLKSIMIAELVDVAIREICEEELG